MSYVVIARKWRPQRFSDVLGQEHVTRTLANAINAERIAHAFLFSGPRGVGKTSAARILAKALCCESTGKPTPEPCGQCRQCVEITEGRSTDVFEIDAASHTGVDNVREIIENVRYLPSAARFKIYVIDEVHMLSTGAFNALLKTLEEPPLHVKFILATTDVHKVPVTILSRCQRYDFRRIPLSGIAERLAGILTKEGVAHDPSALALIAREAEGSMRDAQSLLEQVLAFADGRALDAALVRGALGVVDSALVERAISALLGRQPGEAFAVASEAHDRGLDLKRFADALVEHARDLLAARLVPDPSTVLDRPKDEIAALVATARGVDPVELERLFGQLCRVVDDVAKSSQPRFVLEIELAAIAEKPERVPVEQLLAELTRVEGLLAATAPSAGSPVRRPQQDWRAPNRGTASYSARAPRGDTSAGAEAEPAPVPPVPVPPVPVPPVPVSPVPVPPVPVAAPVPPVPVATPVPPVPVAAPTDPAPGTPFPVTPAARLAASPSDAGESGRPSAQTERSFAGFVEFLRRKRPALAATLGQVRPLAFRGGTTELGCETAFDEGKLKDAETRAYLEGVLSEYFGTPTTLAVVRSSKAALLQEAPRTLTEVEDQNREARRNEKGNVARSHPAVQAASQELGATISKVRVTEEP